MRATSAVVGVSPVVTTGGARPTLTRFHLLVALGVGLLVRASCQGGVEYRFDAGDAASYRGAALTLLEHGVFSYSTSAPFEPTAYRPPGYTAFQAAVAALSGSTFALQLAQVLVSLVSALLLALVARRLAPGSEKPVLWLAMLNPFDAVYASAGLSECVTTALLVGVSATLVLLEGKGRLIGAGALLGALCLFRDIYLALLPFAAGAYLLAGPRQGLAVRLKEVALAGLVAGLVIAPWTARNFVQFHRLIPISAGRLGYSLWMGTWATDGSFTANDATGRSYPAVAFLSDADREAVLGAGSDVGQSEPIFKRLFVERVRAEPLAVVARWVLRWPRLWLGTRFDIFQLNGALFEAGSLRWKLAKASLFGLNGLACLGAAIGFVLAWRRRALVRWAAVPLAFTSLVYLPLNSFENRYSQPMFPFLTLLVGVALVSMWERWFARDGRTS